MHDEGDKVRANEIDTKKRRHAILQFDHRIQTQPRINAFGTIATLSTIPKPSIRQAGYAFRRDSDHSERRHEEDDDSRTNTG
jgi:hypothetical protein